MKKMLYKALTMLVAVSILLNSMGLQTASARQITLQQSNAKNGITAQNQRESAPQTIRGQKALGVTVPDPKNPPVVPPKPVKIEIPTTGGTISSADGGFVITFSPSFGTAFSATLKSIATGNAPVRGMHSVGGGYSLGAALADGTAISSFASPTISDQNNEKNAAYNFIISVKYTDADISDLDETTIAVYTRNSATNKWNKLPSLVNLASHTVLAQADQPGEFAVFAQRQSQVAATGAGSNLKLVIDPDDNIGWTYWNGTRYEELHFNAVLARNLRDKFAADACSVDVRLTRDSMNPEVLGRPFRAQQAIDFGADMFVTIAFNALTGSAWGWQGDGGMEAWARGGHPNDDALVNQFFSRIVEYTGRPHNKPIEHPSRYPAFNALPDSMTYAHIETLFMDHNYDWPVISQKFELITNAAYAAIRTQLEAKGMTCGAGNPLPDPPTAAELQRLRDLGYQNYQTYGADPVSFSTGNHVVLRDLFSLAQNANSTFNFGLVYNSQDSREGYAGIGWSAPIPYVQLYNDDSATATLADGRTYYFTSDGSSGYNTPNDLHATLTKTDKTWLWTDADGSTMKFTEAAQGFAPLTESRDRHGNAYKYEYDFDGQPSGNLRPSLLKMTDTVGNVINFGSDADGRITSITLPGNRTYQLEYTNSTLTKLTDPKGNTYRYEYDNKDRLIKQWDPQGYLFLQNTYDGMDRVVKQIDTNGAVLTLDYAPGVTTYIDNLGNTTQYFFDGQKRVTSIKDASGFTTTTRYDAQDNVLERTDKRGNQFSFTYDGEGHPLTASGPNGYSASYTYNQFGDLTSMTDNGGPNGQARTTRLTVNGKGDVTAIQYADGTGIQMTYDGRGNLKTSKDENGNTSTYMYDSKANLIEISSPLGAKTSFTYDDAGRKTSMTDTNGNTVRFGYDANSNISKIVDPKGSETSFFYDNNDNLVKLVDRRGGVSRYTYDENLKLATETDPQGNVTRYGYDAMYNLVSVTDPEGNVTRYGYNERYEVQQIRSAKGGMTYFAYDADGNVTRITDALGQVTRVEYNGLNLPTATINPLGGRTTIGYDAVGHKLEQTNPRGAKTIFTYDLRDRVIQIEDALMSISKIAYDPTGNPVTYTDATNQSTSLKYNAAGQLVSYTDAAGQVTLFELDAIGNLKKVTDALKRATRYNYDANDNVVSVVDALGNTTSFAYDEEDNLKAAKDARGNLTRFAYDLNGLMTQMTEAGGQTSSFVYNGNGSLAQFTNAKGNRWSFGYDALNQRTSETDPLGQTTKYAYDLLGRLTGATDAKNITTRYQYDALNRLVTVIQNASSAAQSVDTNVTTRYVYDEVGNLKSTLDANGNSTTYTYDLLNRLTQEQNALGNSWYYKYNAIGNMTQRIDGNGDKTSYSYTPTNLLERVSYPDRTTSQFTYDAVGNQLSANTSTLGTITNQYDALNRLTSSTDSARRTIAYTFDEVGNQTRITYPDGKSVGYTYDATNYLSQMTDPQGKITKFTRDLTHNATLIENPNQTLAKYEFDKAEQLKSITNLRKNGDLINSFSYKLDAVGNRIETTALYPYKHDDKDKTEHGRKTQQLISKYQYDPLYRLTSSIDSAGRKSLYSYDSVGNRTRLVTNTDPGGNPGFESEGRHHGLTLNYSYDQINALTKITQGDNIRDLSKVNASLKAFIEQVKAQSGKAIVSATADALIAAATAILTQIQSGTPDQKTLAKAIESLSLQVQNALKQKQIKSEGIAKALLAKLKEAGEGNEHSYPKGTQEINLKYDKNGNRIEQWIARWDNKDVQNQHGEYGVRIKYKYNFENRLVNVSGYLGRQNGEASPEQSGEHRSQINTSMIYDAYGRLFERRSTPGNSGHDAATTVNAQHDGRQTVQFVYDGLDPVAEYSSGGVHRESGNGNSIKHTNYYRGDGRILSMLTNPGFDSHAEDANPEHSSARTQYFHYDGLNSVTAITNNQGYRAESYQYADFGSPLGNNGHIDRDSASSDSSADPQNHFTYTGQDYDSSTGLYHFYAREYDSSTGTWLQQDPYRGQRVAGPVIGDPAAMFGRRYIHINLLTPEHRYGYVGNNPIIRIDILGFWGLDFTINPGLSGGLFGGGSVSVGWGYEVEFPSWNPMEWRAGVTVNTGGSAKTGPYEELAASAGVNLYVWDRKTPIPGASDAPITSCGGVGGFIAAGGGLNINGGTCTGQGQTGFELAVDLLGGEGGGFYGYLSASTGASATVSPNDINNWITNTPFWKWLTSPQQTSAPSNCGCTPPPDIQKLIDQGYSPADLKAYVLQAVRQRGPNIRKGYFTN